MALRGADLPVPGIRPSRRAGPVAGDPERLLPPPGRGRARRGGEARGQARRARAPLQQPGARLPLRVRDPGGPALLDRPGARRPHHRGLTTQRDSPLQARPARLLRAHVHGAPVLAGAAPDVAQTALVPLGGQPLAVVDDAHAAELLDEEEAVLAGYKALQSGKSGLDAVETAIRLMEDSPLFNSAKGAVLTNKGTVALDASIMDGETLNAGAVAGVNTVKNPINLAYEVMVNSPHVMLSGDGAEEFAQERGLEIVDPNYFYTEKASIRFNA